MTDKYVTDNQFQQLVKEGNKNIDAAVRKQYASDNVKAIDEENRQIEFVISTEAVDRYSDIVQVRGISLDNYLKNSVVLFSHDNHQPPPAKCVEIKKRPKKRQLVATAQFPTRDVYEFGDTLYNLYKEGYMRATSIGFKPIEYAWAEEEEPESEAKGLIFKKSELLEWSLVSVGANPEALVAAKKSINMEPLKEWAEKTLDSWGEYKNSGFFVPRREVETLYKKIDGGTQVSMFIPDQNEQEQKSAKVNQNTQVFTPEEDRPESKSASEETVKNLSSEDVVDELTEQNQQEEKAVSEQEPERETETEERDAEDEVFVPDHIKAEQEAEQKEVSEEEAETVQLEIDEAEIKSMIQEVIKETVNEQFSTTEQKEATDTVEKQYEVDENAENIRYTGPRAEEGGEQKDESSVAEQKEAEQTQEREFETRDLAVEFEQKGSEFLNTLDELLSERDAGTLELNRKQLRLLKNIQEALNDSFGVSHAESQAQQSEDNSSKQVQQEDTGDPLDKLVKMLGEIESSIADK